MEEKLEELKTLAEKTVPNPNFAKAIENVINSRKKLEELNSELSKTMSNEIVQNNLKKQIHEATTELEFNSSYLMTFMPLEMENKIAHDPAMKEYVSGLAQQYSDSMDKKIQQSQAMLQQMANSKHLSTEEAMELTSGVGKIDMENYMRVENVIGKADFKSKLKEAVDLLYNSGKLKPLPSMYTEEYICEKILNYYQHGYKYIDKFHLETTDGLDISLDDICGKVAVQMYYEETKAMYGPEKWNVLMQNDAEGKLHHLENEIYSSNYGINMYSNGQDVIKSIDKTIDEVLFYNRKIDATKTEIAHCENDKENAFNICSKQIVDYNVKYYMDSYYGLRTGYYPAFEDKFIKVNEQGLSLPNEIKDGELDEFLTEILNKQGITLETPQIKK